MLLNKSIFFVADDDKVIILLEPGASLENLAQAVAQLQPSGDTEIIYGNTAQNTQHIHTCV